MVATQEKLYNELSTDVINDDDSAAARLYEKYEDLPLVEQLALGFTPVVGETISAYETPIFAKETKEAFFQVFGPDGEFGKAMEVMAVTFTGTLSMLGDKLFKFKLQTNEAGFFDFVKSGLAVANQVIEQNSKQLNAFAKCAKLYIWVGEFAKSSTRASSNNEFAVKRKGWKLNILYLL